MVSFMLAGSPLGIKQCLESLPNLDVTKTSVWELRMPNSKQEFESLISSLLDAIGGTLEKRARMKSRPTPQGNHATYELNGHEVFDEPIGLTSASSQCMLIDPFLVAKGRDRAQERRQKHVSMPPSDGGYATVWLAKRPKSQGAWLKSRAHQIVCFACWGPARADISDPVVMHWCEVSASYLI